MSHLSTSNTVFRIQSGLSRLQQDSILIEIKHSGHTSNLSLFTRCSLPSYHPQISIPSKFITVLHPSSMVFFIYYIDLIKFTSRVSNDCIIPKQLEKYFEARVDSHANLFTLSQWHYVSQLEVKHTKDIAHISQQLFQAGVPFQAENAKFKQRIKTKIQTQFLMKISDVTIPNTKCNKYNIPMPKTPITLTTKRKHKVHQPNYQVPQAKQTGSFCASVCGNV